MPEQKSIRKSKSPQLPPRKNDLGRRIGELRLSLTQNGEPLSRAGFARLLNADRGQIARWENGSESPSPEKLIAMAMCANRLTDRMWFWSRAIPNLQELRADLEAERRSQIKELSHAQTDSGLVRTIPIIRTLRVKGSGNPEPSASEGGELRISAECLAGTGNPVGFLIRPSLLPWSPPPPLNPGDLAVIDRTVLRPAEFFGPKRRMAALLLPRTPMRISGQSFQFDDYSSQGLAELPKGDAFREILEKMMEPLLLFGYLSEQGAADSAQIDYYPEEAEAAPEKGSDDAESRRGLWRLIFSAGPLVIALTDWERDKLPRDTGGAPLLNRASIFGAVVGWMNWPSFVGEQEGNSQDRVIRATKGP